MKSGSEAAYQLTVHFRDGLSGFLWGGELHKADPSADAGAGVPQHLAGHDGTKLLHTNHMLPLNNTQLHCWV